MQQILYFICFSVFLMIAYRCYQLIVAYIKIKNSPVREMYTTIVSKSERKIPSSYFKLFMYTELKEFCVTFQLENGENLEFLVPPSLFCFMLEGQKGILSTQGTKFISFTHTRTNQSI